MRRQSLREQVEGYLLKQWVPSSEAIDRKRLVELAGAYLDQAGEAEVEG